MAQFDVFKNPRGGRYPLLVDVQSELLERLATRVVVPMTARSRYGAKPISRLNPIATVRGTDYVLVFQELAAIPIAALVTRVGSIVDQRAELVAAIDLLFTGI